MALEKIDIRKRLLEYSISEFRVVPEYIAMCEAIAQGMGTVQDAVDYISNMIDLDSAEGVWLDFIGILVGTYRRHISENIKGDFFQVNAEDINREVEFYFPNKTSNSGSTSGALLNDNEFRSQIKAKIAFNIGKGTREGNINTIKAFTRADIVKITQESPMLLNIVIYGDNLVLTTDTYMKDTIEQFLPNGVSINEFEVYRLNIIWNTPKELINVYPLWNDIVYANDKFLMVGNDGYIGISDNGEKWTVLKLPIFENLNKIKFLNNKFFAIGNNGYISTSPDGIDWTEPIQVGTNNWQSITYGNGMFVIVGNNYVSTSVDGINWTEPVNKFYYIAFDIVYENGLFVTVNNNGRIYVSEDANTWTIKNINENIPLKSIIYENGKFIIVGYNNKIVISTDLETWTVSEIADDENSNYFVWNKIFFDGSKYICVGQNNYTSSQGIFIVSEDLSNWNEMITFNNYLNSIAKNNDKYICISNRNNYFVSLDSITWSNAKQIGGSNWTSIAYGNSVFMGVGKGLAVITDNDNIELKNLPNDLISNCISYGQNKFVIGCKDGYVVTTEDGINFSNKVQIGTTREFNLNSIAYNGTKAVAVGDYGYVIWSTDGIVWSNPFQIDAGYSTYPNWSGITYGNGKFVVVGDNGLISTSTDGITWSSPETIYSGFNDNLSAIIYANNKFVATSEWGHVSTSTDGITWTEPVQINSNNYEWNSITYGNGKFIVVAVSGWISTSTDAINWTTPIQIGEGENLYNYIWNDIIYANGYFYAVGKYLYENGRIIKSIDGINWIDEQEISNVSEINSIIFNDSLFIACCNEGKVLTSNDGENWDLINIGENNWNNIIYTNNKFIMVGDLAYIETSMTGTQWNEPIKYARTVNYLNNSIYANGKFVMVGSKGYISLSSDAQNWSFPIEVGTNDWQSITYGANKYVVVGNNGYISTSVDGITWTNPIQIGNNNWYGVAYGNNVFIVVGQDGYISYSNDGTNWIEPIQIDVPTLNAIIYSNGRFVAVGYYGFSIVTVNGKKWLNKTQLGTATWNSIAYGNNTFAVTSNSSYIMLSSEQY